MKRSKMLKLFGIFLCSFLLLVGCGQKDVASSEEVKVEPMEVEFETKDFSNEDYQLKYPATWTTQTHPDVKNGTAFMCGTQDPEINFLANASVLTFTESFSDIDDYMKQLQHELNACEDTDPMKNLKMEKIILASGEAVKTTFSTYIGDKEVKRMQLHIFNKDTKRNYAIIAYANLTNDFDKQLEGVMYMGDTFKFKK